MDILSPRIEAHQNLFTRMTTLTLNKAPEEDGRGARESILGSIYISVTFP